MSDYPSLKVLKYDSGNGKGILFYILIFLVVTILSYLVLYAWNPQMLQKVDSEGKPTGKADVWSILFISIVIALIVDVIYWLIKRKM
jgi:Kef-type K+ transport system membrane component KefB